MITIGLDNPKTSFNIASILRLGGCYGIDSVFVRGTRYKKHHADVNKDINKIPLINTDDLKATIPFNSVPVAVEFIDSAENIINFKHPKNCYYIFGAEDNTLGKRILEWCKHVVYIPTKKCLNLSQCVNVILYDRMSKEIVEK